MPHFDVAIIGLGAMGSASAYSLTERGASVVAFDRFAPPHMAGSTHGHTRIIREAYYEHPLYVPLVRRAYELWQALQRAAGIEIFVQTGGLMVGPERGPLFRGALESAKTHGLTHEILAAPALAKRFPAYSPRSHWSGLFDHRAGMLFPEKCVEAQLRVSRERGAILHLNEEVKSWTSSGSRVTVSTATGTYEADRLVVAAGPWLPSLSASLGVTLPLVIERQLSHWFEPVELHDDRFRAARCPIGLWEMPDGDVFATLPDEGHGVKCGMHHAGASTSPESVHRAVTKGENAVARELLEQIMPGAGGRLLEARVCLYTNTPDRHFIIDWLDDKRVLVVSACSGHGFKFASAIGEVVSQLALDGRSWLDLTPFALARFR